MNHSDPIIHGEILRFNFWTRLADRFLSWFIESGPTLLFILVGSYVLFQLVKVLAHRLERMLVIEVDSSRDASAFEHKKRLQTLIAIVSSTVKVILIGMALLLVLREIGVDIAPILAGAGVVGLAVGFGAQNLVKDVISGFFILLENQIRAGDVVEINGTGGLVESINLRTTILRDLSGVVHIFPNGSIEKISNMTKDWSAYVFDIRVDYNENVDQVITAMKTVGAGMQNDSNFNRMILAPLEIFGVDKFEDNAVVIKARFKTKPSMQWDVGREYQRRLKSEFDRLGITIPFPQRTIHIEYEQVVGLKKT